MFSSKIDFTFRIDSNWKLKIEAFDYRTDFCTQIYYLESIHSILDALM